MEFFVNNIWLVPIFSLVAFIVISIGNAFIVYRNNVVSMYLTCASTFLGFLFSVCAFFYCYFQNNLLNEKTFNWIMVDTISFDIGWMSDNLSIMMLVMVCFISFLVQVYSSSYMRKDPGYSRFFGYLALFNFSMTGLVLSPNLFQAYIFWELVGLCSYLLIGFWYKKQSASKAAFKAFVINRVGDFGFLLGLIAFGVYTFNYWINTNASFLSFSDLNMAVFYLDNIYGAFTVFVVGSLFLLAACAKSAQFPLYVWLPDAMEAPTPVSALIHAATMVVAGVFLIARLYPFFSESAVLMNLVLIIGLITAVLCALFALFEFDIKRILAYSTCSQLGYMFIALGIGAYSAGLFHMFTHSFAKALLFLAAGCVIVSLNHRQNILDMGGLRKKIPVVAYSFLVGVISLSGLFFSGFSSKEDIFHSVIQSGNIVLFLLFCFLSILTSLYMFRMYFLVFEGESRNNVSLMHLSGFITMPVVILAFISAVFGFLFNGSFGIRKFDDLVSYSFSYSFAFSWRLAFVSILLSLIGAVLAYCIFIRKKGIFSKTFWINYFEWISSIFRKGLFIDAIYEKILPSLFSFVTKILNFFDKFFIDGFVILLGKIVFLKSYLMRLLHSSNTGVYVVISVGWLIFTCVILYAFKVLFV